MRRMLLGTAMASLLCCLGSVAGAQSFSFVSIDVPAAMGLQTNPSDINESGVVVGDYFTADARPCDVGFVLRQGAFETFKHPDAECSQVSDLHTAITGVNEGGDLVGFYQSKTSIIGGRPRVIGFVQAGGVLSDVAYPGAADTYPMGIDDRGRIVGYYNLADDESRAAHGFLRDAAGNYQTLDAGDARDSWLYRINARDEIVGSRTDLSYGEHGFVYQRGTFTALDYPGALGTIPWGIASNGRVVGYAYSDSCESYVCAFVWDRGVFQLFAYPGATETHPAAINGRGAVVGAFIDEDGGWHGFMAQPH